MNKTSKITDKGQVTIPKEVREVLGSKQIRFEIVNNKVYLEPIKSVGGALSKYVKVNKLYFEEERDIAWNNVAKERK